MSATPLLNDLTAETYAAWFATLGDPTRVRVLHAIASTPDGGRVGEIAARVGIAQATCSHHVRLLADADLISLTKEGTSTVARINDDCCHGLPHAVDAVLGTLDTLPCCPEDIPGDVTVRALQDRDWPDVERVFVEGIATGNASFDTEAPPPGSWDARWLPDHRLVAEVDGSFAGWASLSPCSPRDCYAGVAETQVYVAEACRGRRVGVALLDRLVRDADDAGLWTLQAQAFTENKTSLRLHRSAGFRTVGIRERIGQRDGVWRDTVLLERRR